MVAEYAGGQITRYRAEYFHQDHLGNTRLGFSDFNQNGRIDLEEEDPNTPLNEFEITQESHYYPFGMNQDGPWYAAVAPENKYLYNGKELNGDYEINLLDYGARWYDGAIGRWTAVDPLAEKYFSLSPYNYVANSPINAIDPDGERILFVNGHWQKGWKGNLIGSNAPKQAYWGRGFERAAQKFFNDYSKVADANYIDGSSGFGIDESGRQRKKRGYNYAKKNYKRLTEGLTEGETFKLVTHSEGSAFGAGIAEYLIGQGHLVETVLHLSPDEGDEFNTSEWPMTYELSYGGDIVTGNKGIGRGVDIRGVVDKFTKQIDKTQFSHGSTKSAGVFKDVEAMLRAAANGATGVNVTETQSGIKFEFIRDNGRQ